MRGGVLSGSNLVNTRMIARVKNLTIGYPCASNFILSFCHPGSTDPHPHVPLYWRYWHHLQAADLVVAADWWWGLLGASFTPALDHLLTNLSSKGLGGGGSLPVPVLSGPTRGATAISSKRREGVTSWVAESQHLLISWAWTRFWKAENPHTVDWGLAAEDQLLWSSAVQPR